MRKTVLGLFVFGCFAAIAATPTITGVTAQQRYPWNGKVDISYTVTGDIAAEAKQSAGGAMWCSTSRVRRRPRPTA